MWTVACGAPTSDWTVRSMSSSRAWVSTEMRTSSGMRPPSMSAADEVEVGLAGGREADLDLLVAHADEQVEHRVLAGRVHRVDEGLVAVAQVGGQPPRRGLDGFRRPGAVGQVDAGEAGVAVVRHARGLLRAGTAGGAAHDGGSRVVWRERPARTFGPATRGRPELVPGLAAAAKEQRARHGASRLTDGRYPGTWQLHFVVERPISHGFGCCPAPVPRVALRR